MYCYAVFWCFVVSYLFYFSCIVQHFGSVMWKCFIKKKKNRSTAYSIQVTCGQVWWPIHGICALILTYPKCTHTVVNTHKPWTHTRSSGQPFMLQRPGSGALLKGTSVMVLRMERALYIHSPPPTIPAGPRLELATFGLQFRLSNH